jgi:glycosyltransferase involved in cell wall biosynthesis
VPSVPTILLLNQYYAPDEAATAQMLADLGEGLAARGARVVAITSDRSYADPSRRYPARETIRGVEVRRVRTTGFGRATKPGRIADYFTFLAGAKLQLLFGPAPDAVVSLSTPPLVALLGSFIGRIRGARTLFWSMDVYPDVAYELGAIRKGSLTGRLVASLARLTHRLPDVVVALGDTMKAKLEEGGANDVAVIHNWADGDAIRPMPVETNELRRAWGWSDRFVILYSGNMGLGHEFETALLGTARVALNAEGGLRNAESGGPTPRLAFIGAGPRRHEIEQRAVDLGLLEAQASHSEFRIPNSEFAPATVPPLRIPHSEFRIHFRPPLPRDQIAMSLTAADVHLVTMRDGMQGLIVPSKIYGILAAGRPTIYVGPAEGEIYEIVAGGACGVHVAIGDAAGFANAVERYASDPALVRAHGENARRLFDERFTRERGIEEFRKALKLL